MKHKHKTFKKLGALIFLLTSTMIVTSCDLASIISEIASNIESSSNIDDPKYQIYLLAKESGYNGTYEEWLESIKGDQIELRVNNNNIEWKYSNESSWTILTSLSNLKGENGETPKIGYNGNWWIGNNDTGISATGPKGAE